MIRVYTAVGNVELKKKNWFTSSFGYMQKQGNGIISDRNDDMDNT